MTYEEVLPLSEVKLHLQLESDYDDEDIALERMVRSALQYIEKRTNHIFNLRLAETYSSECAPIKIFDYPIRFINPDNVTILYYSDNIRVYAENITADVGYLTLEDIPSALIDAALIMISGLYYKSEVKDQSQANLFMDDVNRLINPYRRFTVC